MTAPPRLPLATLRRRYLRAAAPLSAEARQALQDDPRAGAQSILAAIDRRLRRNRIEGQRLRKMLTYERALWDAGTSRVGGVDEAGMSPLAGPVVAAAVILPVGCRIARVDDSKKLSKAVRETLAVTIKAQAVSWAIGRVEPYEIDAINIYHAGLLAMRRAVEGLSPEPQALLVDARTVPGFSGPQTGLIKGDTRSLSIAAASILAKTTRDAFMVALDQQWPGYGFAQHKGYPVAQHQDALRRLGPMPLHRRSFPVVQRLVAEFEARAR